MLDSFFYPELVLYPVFIETTVCGSHCPAIRNGELVLGEFDEDSKKEMVTLYRWWTEGRKEEERQLGQILTLLDEKPISKNEYKRRLEAYGKKEREISETQMQMMLRLVRVHPSLWE